MSWVLILIVAVFFFYVLVFRQGKPSFWKIVARYPDFAYDFFLADSCWKVFEDGLPANYREIVPKNEWRGPFLLFIPKLGVKGQLVHIFGRYPDFEESQDALLILLAKDV